MKLSLLLILLIALAFPTFSQTRPQHNTIFINEYSTVLSIDPCKNNITLGNPADFQIGDSILIIQMQGAVIDSSNTFSFGNILDYRCTGNYEFNSIKSLTGNVAGLANNVTRRYDVKNGKVQIVNIHPYTSYTVNDPISCPDWDGSTGGVIVLFVQDTLTLNQPIDAGSRGFRGGVTANFKYDTLACSKTDYYADSAAWQYARKGEGIALLGFDKWNGRGKFANGGGGGNAQNSGGGGGGSFGPGGNGGYQLDSCGSAPFDNGGVAGTSLTYSNAANQIYMGGGGGAGHMDSDNPAFFAFGGPGGGIIIVKAGSLQSNIYGIKSAGGRGKYCYSCTNDGTGAGGAGGTILMDIGTYLDSATITATGGDGSLVLNFFAPTQRVGPGGGGAGGVIWFNGNIPTLARTSLTGGINGIIYDDALNPWGATPGSNGAVLNNLKMPFDTVLFILPVAVISQTVSNCNAFSFTCSITPSYLPVASWLWSFSDGFKDSMQNPMHTYRISGSLPVGLTITDTNGCITNTIKTIMVSKFPTVTATKSNDVDCSHGLVQLKASGAVRYDWKPATTLDNSGIANPIASPTQQTTYTVTGWDSIGLCYGSDTVVVKISMLNSSTLLMPSAFTPNNDGLNDCFGIKGWGAVQQLDFTIFNRWGEIMYHSTNATDCWDGKVKGLYQSPGTYVYTIKAKTLCGAAERNGTLVLIR